MSLILFYYVQSLSVGARASYMMYGKCLDQSFIVDNSKDSFMTVVIFIIQQLYWLLKLIKQKAEFPFCIRDNVFQVIHLPLYVKTHFICALYNSVRSTSLSMREYRFICYHSQKRGFSLTICSKGMIYISDWSRKPSRKR